MLYTTYLYIVRMLPGMLAALALFFCLRPLRRRRLAETGLCSGSLREGMLALFWMFCAGLALLTLTPPWFNLISVLLYPSAPWPAFFSMGSVNLVPFRTFGLAQWTLYILLGNIIMFVPIGFCAALLWRGFCWSKVLGLGLAVTLLIECWQLLVGRAFDVDDLMLNALGVLCGYWLWLALRRLAPDFAAQFQVRPRRENL